MDRVAVVDFDVHHGNGTEDVLCRTRHPGFFYASIHAFNRGEGDGSQPRIFPGTGAAGEAHSHVLNIPLGDQVYVSCSNFRCFCFLFFCRSLEILLALYHDIIGLWHPWVPIPLDRDSVGS